VDAIRRPFDDSPAEGVVTQPEAIRFVMESRRSDGELGGCVLEEAGVVFRDRRAGEGHYRGQYESKGSHLSLFRCDPPLLGDLQCLYFIIYLIKSQAINPVLWLR